MNEELQRWSRILATWAQTKPEIAEVWLFGSRALGDHRPDSDLGVAVVMTDGPMGTRYGNWAFLSDEWKEDLKALLPVAVDLDIGDADISTTIVSPALKRESARIFCRKEEMI